MFDEEITRLDMLCREEGGRHGYISRRSTLLSTSIDANYGSFRNEAAYALFQEERSSCDIALSQAMVY